MATFQLSVSKTFTVHTDDWAQDERDALSEELEKVGWKRPLDSTQHTNQPTTQQCELAMRSIIETEGGFWNAYIDVRTIEPKDVRIVCINRDYEPQAPKEETMNAPSSDSRPSEVAKPLPKSDESPKEKPPTLVIRTAAEIEAEAAAKRKDALKK